MKIYISGKVSGNENYMADFIRMDHMIKIYFPKAEVINPVRVNANLPESTTWDEYMNMCYLMLDMADAIIMMDNWESSKGACIEYGYSLARDKIILFEHDLKGRLADGKEAKAL